MTAFNIMDYVRTFTLVLLSSPPQKRIFKSKKVHLKKGEKKKEKKLHIKDYTLNVLIKSYYSSSPLPIQYSYRYTFICFGGRNSGLEVRLLSPDSYPCICKI